MPRDESSSRGTLHEIITHLPGFKGYFALETRRDADKVARDHVAAAIKEARVAVEEALGERARRGDLSGLTPLQTLSDRMARQIARIAHADHGAGGFFDTRPITKEVLEEAYAADLAVLDHARTLAQTARGLAGRDDQGEAVKDVDKALDAVAEAFEHRQKILKGVA